MNVFCLMAVLKLRLPFASCLVAAVNPCLRMNCDFMCLLNPMGATCTCPEGKVLINGSCSDVNISGKLFKTPAETSLTGCQHNITSKTATVDNPAEMALGQCKLMKSDLSESLSILGTSK